MVAVIAGASGLVGSVLLRKLLASDAVAEVIAVGRRSLGLSDSKLKEVLLSDFSKLEEKTSELRGDVYFCALGTTIKTAGSQDAFRRVDHDAVVGFGRVAAANGAKAFVVVSATGASDTSMIFYNRVKGETEKDLGALGLASLTIFRPSLLLGHRREFRFGEKVAEIVVGGLTSVLPAGVTRRLGTDVGVLADQMLRLGLRPSSGRRIIEASDIV